MANQKAAIDDNRNTQLACIFRRARVFANGEFNLQGQQLNSFSLQRSEMFIATSARPRILAPLGAKPGSVTFAGAAKAIALLQSSGVKNEPAAINISPPTPHVGQSDKQCSVALRT
jgi:hypothetical protein